MGFLDIQWIEMQKLFQMLGQIDLNVCLHKLREITKLPFDLVGHVFPKTLVYKGDLDFFPTHTLEMS